MPNYELKALIFNDMPECLDVVKAYKKREYLFDYCHFDQITDELESMSDAALELYQLSPAVFDECERIYNADKARRKRLRKRIENMFTKGTCVFLTLTFTDDILSTTDEKTRRVYVARFLKSVSTEYVGNVDFGKENGREHYHAVILSDQDDFSSWTYGFYKAITVRKDNADAKRLATYISKLTNHAIKETTKRNALIYSR